MRRYQLKYHVVGGFSFYERAEIKDMISYLKVIHNPDDSISLLRVINTPVRGIGKTTIETVEHVALETGLSLWGAIGESIRRQLLPQRALLALKAFHDLIEDARDLTPLLQACPHLQLLVTSRIVLRIAAEQVFELEPMATPADDLSATLGQISQSEAVQLVKALRDGGQKY